ncbi:MAG TPA: hypothetical protein VGS12_12035 [Caulobacteraceae bacterium]|nr:hypothetical protein [Caulobacteraceae bacterium]
MLEEPLAFDYLAQVRGALTGVMALLDLGTGGGEVLSALAPLPATTVATEAYAPNAFVAARRLAPVDGHVVLAQGAPENWSTLATPVLNRPSLPFRDAAFELVIDRHESYLPAEVLRVLRPGGRFITQQCGGSHMAALNDLLGIPRPPYADWRSEAAVAQLAAAGFEVILAREQFTATRFADVGAIAYYLRAVPWQAPGFRAADHASSLRAIHERIQAEGPLAVPAHHFLVEARRPRR